MHGSGDTPTEQYAGEIVRTALNEEVHAITRFTTGLAHNVYEVTTASGLTVVVRIAPQGVDTLAGALYWSDRLRPLGVPLPRILHSSPRTHEAAFPYVILERLAGTDLGNVYPQLSRKEKRSIATGVVRAQALVGEMPQGSGFGYAASYEATFRFRSWIEVIRASLERSRSRIKQFGLFDSSYVERIEEQLPRYQDLLTSIRPVAFLDDTTTKNVIVNDGRLSGIVDVDVVCFGDPLWTVGLTQIALLGSGFDLEYVNAWCELLGLTGEKKRLLNLYSTIFCVDFMSEIGLAFNQLQAKPVDRERVQRLIEIYNRLMQVV